MWMVLGIVAGVGVASALVVRAIDSSMGFRAPSDVVEQHMPVGKRFQLGGMVEKGSFQRTPGSLRVQFTVTDFRNRIPVVYEKVLPDLFKEDTVVVANGHLDPQGTFVADEVLAKHDENYRPPAVDKALKKGESRMYSQPATP
jgi:cytochrome c-type biogenesis protein CcmE